MKGRVIKSIILNLLNCRSFVLLSITRKREKHICIAHQYAVYW